jgi:hypothetical protein
MIPIKKYEDLTPFQRFEIFKYGNITVWQDESEDPNVAYEEEKERELFDFITPEPEKP